MRYDKMAPLGDYASSLGIDFFAIPSPYSRRYRTETGVGVYTKMIIVVNLHGEGRNKPGGISLVGGVQYEWGGMYSTGDMNDYMYGRPK